MKPKTLIIIVAAAGLPLMLALIGMGSWVFLDKLRTQTRARDVAVYLYRGYAATSQNDWGEAVINYSKTIKLAPTNGSAFYFRGDAYFREGEYEPAISDFTSAIRLNPNDYRAREYRGVAYGVKRDWDQANTDFTEAIQIRPKNGEAYFRRAYTYTHLGQWTNAINDYEKATQLNHKRAFFVQSLAYAYYRSGDSTNSLKNYRKALRMAPEDPGILNGLAWFLAVHPDAAFRDGPEAVRLAEMACRFSDWRATGYIDTLAAAYAETGDFTNAVKYEQQALRIDVFGKSQGRDEKLRLDLYQHGQPFRETSPGDEDDN